MSVTRAALTPDPDERPRSWRSLVLPWVLPVVLAILLLGVVATSVVLVRDRRAPGPAVAMQRPADIGADDGSPDGSSKAAADAVEMAAVAATTYFTVDYRTVRTDMNAMRDLGTEDFVAAYDTTADSLVKRVKQREVTLTAELPRGAVATEYLTATTAQVLVAVDVTTERAAVTSTSAYRTRVTLERTGDTWLVSAFDEVP
ncbi:hypothetical protein BH11ACT8_BH11ACT8_28600 [soil metagenome]